VIITILTTATKKGTPLF